MKESSNKIFIELKGLTTKEIIQVFQKSKVYIDFGYHPGKDKMPREAAIFENCIITNLKGSAGNKFDIPINKKFKFKQTYSDLNKINSTIDSFFDNNKENLNFFLGYKKKILKEEKEFKKQLLSIFRKLK